MASTGSTLTSMMPARTLQVRIVNNGLIDAVSLSTQLGQVLQQAAIRRRVPSVQHSVRACCSLSVAHAYCSLGPAGGFIFRIEHGKPKDVPEVETRLTGQIILLDYPRKNVSDASLQYLTK